MIIYLKYPIIKISGEFLKLGDCILKISGIINLENNHKQKGINKMDCKPDQKKVKIVLWNEYCDDCSANFGDNHYKIYGVYILGYQKKYNDYAVDSEYFYCIEPESNVENFDILGIDVNQYKKFSINNDAKIGPYCLHWTKENNALLSLEWLENKLTKLGYIVETEIND